MSRKFEAINLMVLYTKGDTTAWNAMLTACLENRDINTLAKVRYQIQAGMDDLAKNKLNTDEINVWYIRLLKSLEKTAKQIIRLKHPLPGDNPLLAKTFGPEFLETKRKRDQELMSFMSRSSY